MRLPLLLALTAASLAARPAAAQLVGVPLPPPRPVPPAPRVAQGGGADGRTAAQAARDSAQAVQRLDIQAWVDSAAPALSRAPRTPPPAVPADAAAPAPPLRPVRARPAPRRPSREAGRARPVPPAAPLRTP